MSKQPEKLTEELKHTQIKEFGEVLGFKLENELVNNSKTDKTI